MFSIRAALISFILVVFSSGCSSSFLGSASSKYWTPDFKVRRDVLPNGLTILYVEDRSVPVVSYTTWFKVGSAWEKPGSTGIAHLFEHMMFKGTPRFSAKEFYQRLESKGAVVNAFTQQDATVYYEVIASQHLEMVIEMEADRLSNLRFTKADLDSEREVVKEERRLRVDSNFTAQLIEHLQKMAFSKHPYGWPIIGYQEDLNRLSLEECVEFFKTYYQPANAVITIAGDFDYQKTREWIRKYYGPIKGHPVPQIKLDEEKTSGKEARSEIYRPVKAESIVMGYYVPSMYSEDAEKLSMLAWTLFGMSSSRANLRLVREKHIALNVGADASFKRFPFLFFIWAEMKHGIGAQVVERELDRLIEEIQRTPPSEDELARVKNALIYATVNEAKSPAGIASWLASGEFYWNDYRHVYKVLDAYHQVTPKDLQEMAMKYLRKENRVVAVMKPGASKRGGK
ncbi:MAG: pitrilysin family protein [Bdellovibrionota bacterium]